MQPCNFADLKFNARRLIPVYSRLRNYAGARMERRQEEQHPSVAVLVAYDPVGRSELALRNASAHFAGGREKSI